MVNLNERLKQSGKQSGVTGIAVSAAARNWSGQASVPASSGGYQLTTKGGKSYTISNEQADWIRKRYQSSFTDYYGSDDEDRQRATAGVMPTAFEKGYGNNRLDRDLYENGLPSSKYIDDYVSAYYDWYGDGSAYDFGDDAASYMQKQFKDSWTYDATIEDQQRKAQGLMPSKIAGKYADTYRDEQLLSQGLPPEALLGSFVDSYHTTVNQKSRVDAFYAEAAARMFNLELDGIKNDGTTHDVLDENGNAVKDDFGDVTQTTGSDRWNSVFFDLLESDAWADVSKLYKGAGKTADSVDRADFDDALSYREARIAANNKANAVSASDDGVSLSYTDFLGQYTSDYRKLLYEAKIADDAVAASGISTYGQLLEQADAERAQAVYDGIKNRADARAYISDVLESDPSADLSAALQGMIDHGVDEKHVRQAYNYLKGKVSAEELADVHYVVPWKSKGSGEVAESAGTDIASAFAEKFPLLSASLGAGLAAKDAGAAQLYGVQDGGAAVQRADETGEKLSTVQAAYSAGRDRTKLLRAAIDSAVKTYSSAEFPLNNRDEAAQIYAAHVQVSGNAVDPDSDAEAREAMRKAGFTSRQIDAVASEYAQGNENVTPESFWERLSTSTMDVLSDPNTYALMNGVAYMPDEGTVKSVYSDLERGEMAGILEKVRAAAIAKNAEVTDFDFDQAMREAGYASMLDSAASAKHYFAGVEYPLMLSGAEKAAYEKLSAAEKTAQAYAAYDSFRPEQIKEYEDYFQRSYMSNPDVAKSASEVFAYQGILSAIPKAAAGIVSGAVSFADMAASIFDGRSESWEFTKDVNDFTAYISNFGRSNQSILTKGVSAVSDIGSELARMYALNAAGSVIGGAALSTNAAYKTMSKGMKLLTKAGAFAVNSTPFILTAAGNYYSEALQGGATMEQARTYGLICGAMEGAVEALQMDSIWGKAFGSDRIAKSIINGGKEALSGSYLTKAKLVNLAASFFGEYTEEASSYALSWLLSSKQGWNDDGFSWQELNKQGLMGGIVGIFGSALQLPRINNARIVADYMVDSGDYSATNFDILMNDVLASGLSDDARAQYEAMGYAAILHKEDYASTIQNIRQSASELSQMDAEQETELGALEANYKEKLAATKKVENLLAHMKKDGIDPTDQRVIDARNQLAKLKTSSTLTKAYNKERSAKENAFAARKEQHNRALAKSQERFNAHNANMSALFAEDVRDIERYVKGSAVAKYAYRDAVKAATGIDLMIYENVVDPDAYETSILNQGRAAIVADSVRKTYLDRVEAKSKTDAKMRAARAGKAEAYAEAVQGENAQGKAEAPSSATSVQAGSQKRVALTEDEMERVLATGKELGLEVNFKQLPNWVNGYIQDGVIVLNSMQKDAGLGAGTSAAMCVFTHEMTHALEGTDQYNAFADHVIGLVERETGSAKEDLYAAMQNMYREESGGEKELTLGEARREVVSFWASQNLLTSEKAIQKLVRERSGIAGKLLNVIQYNIAKIKARVSGTPEARMLLDAERMYVKAFAAAGKSPAEGMREYAVGTTVGGRPIAIVTEDILAGVPESAWIPTTLSVLEQRFPDGITIDSKQIKVTLNSRNELTRSRYSQDLFRNDPAVYKDKMNAAANADDVLTAASTFANEPIHHKRKDDIVSFDRGAVLLRIGQHDYEAEVLVGRTKSGGMRLHDIVEMKKAKHALRRSYSEGSAENAPAPAVGTGVRHTDPVTHSMPENGENVNTGSEKVDSARDRQYNISGGIQNGRNETDAGADRGIDRREVESTRSEAVSQRGVLGRGNRGNLDGLLLKEEYRSRLTQAGVTDFGLSTTENHQAFSDALARMRSENKDGGSVDPKTVQELEGSVTFMNAEGTAGGAVQPDGNIVAVFKNKAADARPYAGRDIILNAVARGGDRLDCYGVFLANTYARGGMEPVARVTYARGFNPEMDAYIDDMRAKGKKGFETDPDIYFMKLRTGATMEGVLSDIESGSVKLYTQAELDALPLMEYEEAEKYRNGLIEQESAQAPDEGASSLPEYSVSGTWEDYLGIDRQAADAILLSAGQETPLEELVRKFGPVKPGMQPRDRDIDVPAQINDTDKVSLFARSALESQHIDDEVLPMIEQLIADGELGVYQTVTNKKTLENAEGIIVKNGGLTGAYNYFHSAVENDNVRAGKASDMIALGEKLLAEAAGRKDAKSVLELTADLSILATESGRAVQAFSMLKKLGPAGSLYYMQRVVERMNAKYAGQIGQGKMERLAIDPALASDLLNARTEEQLHRAEAAVTQYIGSRIPLTFKEALRNWRYFSMLANPVTHIRNLTGNVLMSGFRTAKDAVAAGIEAGASKIGLMNQEDRAHALYSAKAEADRVELADRMWEKYKADTTSGGKFGFESELRRYMKQSNVKSLNWAMKKNSDLLEGEDVIFLRGAFRNAFTQYMVAQNIDPAAMTAEQESAAANWAISEAQRATFRDASTLAATLNDLAKKKYIGLIVDGTIPFKKTPINIAKRGVDYSPAGLLYGMGLMLHDVKTNGGKITAKSVDRVASGLTGSAVMMLGYFLAKAGILRGNGEDKENYEKFLQSTGEQAYSINIGDVSVGISNIAPATIPLFLGVQLYNAAGKGKDGMTLSDVAEIAAGIVDPLMEMSFMSSLNEALQSYNSDAAIGGAVGQAFLSAGKSYASQYLPTVFGKLNKVLDPVVRTTKGDAASQLGSTTDSWLRAQAKKIPGLSRMLEPTVDVFGEEVRKDSFADWALDFANNFVLPVNVKIKDRDKVDREIIRVFEATGNTDILPVSPQKYVTVGGRQYKMTAQQYTQYSEEYGQSVYASIKALMLTDAYRSADTDARSSMLKKAVERAEGTVRDKWKIKLADKAE